MMLWFSKSKICKDQIITKYKVVIVNENIIIYHKNNYIKNSPITIYKKFNKNMVEFAYFSLNNPNPQITLAEPLYLL
jgi:intracellular septation protein A